MKLVVQMLEGEHDLPTPPNPFICTGPTKTNVHAPKKCCPPFQNFEVFTPYNMM